MKRKILMLTVVSLLAIPAFAAIAALEDAGFVVTDVVLTAKAKALNPGKGKGKQNNPFSNTDTFDLP